MYYELTIKYNEHKSMNNLCDLINGKLCHFAYQLVSAI